MTEILPRLFIGDRRDAREWQRPNGCILCVMPRPPIDEPPMALWVNIVGAGGRPEKASLTAAARIIRTMWEQDGREVLVHCETGNQYAPLVLVWYFHSYGDVSLDEAYALIERKRPDVIRQGLLA